MNLREFLSSDICKLPKERPNDLGFRKFVDKINQEFLIGLQKVTSSGGMASDILTKSIQSQLDIVRDQIKAIDTSLGKYDSGKPSEAFSVLENFISKNRKLFYQLKSISIEEKVFDALFRIRVKDNSDFSRSQMFHIPFELRHKISSQRYSIPGNPCLYLGSSVYLCWIELGCPTFDKVYGVRLEAAQKLKVLNFGYAPSVVADALVRPLEDSPGYKSWIPNIIPANVLFWPIIAACSIKVLYINDPFKPEHILPQMIMQYIRLHNKDVDGICYFSIHFGEKNVPFDLQFNFVFPVFKNSEKGICGKLAQKFRMTEVFPFQVLRSYPVCELRKQVSDSPIELVRGVPVPYNQTEFGTIELLLKWQKAIAIK